jgi:pyrrolidone-carboxylate peptidase
MSDVTSLTARRVAILAALFMLLGVLVSPWRQAQAADRTDCIDPNAPVGVEQARLTRTLGTNPIPVPQQILERSGFGDLEARFIRALCTATKFNQAENAAANRGARLWRAAVDRVQGRDVVGDLPAGDDRPLYWARLQMTRAIQQYRPDFALSDEQRHDLIWAVEVNSRGQGNEINLPAGADVDRMLISGFDPFTLDPEPRRGNPSGAAILSLDGTTVDTDEGTVYIESVILPVNWTEFDLGMVEDAFGPFMQGGRRQVDATMTISQGGNRFDIEQWNGRFRTGTSNDGINPCTPPLFTRPECQITPPTQWVPFEPPQWTSTTQPVDALLNADTGPYLVNHRTSVREFLVCGQTETVFRPDGPSSLDACARSGGGGSYLSNEVAYRVTLLRDALGVDIPAGHLHIPPMPFAPDNGPSDPNPQITDPVFEQNRANVASQTRDLVRVAARAIDN